MSNSKIYKIRYLLIIGLASAFLLTATFNCKDSTEGATLDWYSSLAAGSTITDNGDGSATDSTTNLTWMKCSYGQVYNSGFSNCQGTGSSTTYGAKSMQFCEIQDDNSLTDCVNTDPIIPYASSGPAFDACDGLNLAGQTDWRLPTKSELVNLANLQDSVTLAYTFPDTPDDKYFWTGNGTDDGNDETAYGVSFAVSTFGTVDSFTKAGSNLYVRCVRP